MLSGKHILIENCPGLGDLVMVTPALRKIKELYPDCEVELNEGGQPVYYYIISVE